MSPPLRIVAMDDSNNDVDTRSKAARRRAKREAEQSGARGTAPASQRATPPEVSTKPPSSCLPLSFDVQLDAAALDKLGSTYTEEGPPSVLELLSKAAANPPASTSTALRLVLSHTSPADPPTPDTPAGTSFSATPPTPSTVSAASPVSSHLPTRSISTALTSPETNMSLEARFEAYVRLQEQEKKEREKKEKEKELEREKKERERDAETAALRESVAELDSLRQLAYKTLLQTQYEDARELLRATYGLIRAKDGSLASIPDSGMLRSLRTLRRRFPRHFRQLSLPPAHLALTSLAQFIGYTVAHLRRGSAHSAPSPSSFTSHFGSLLGSSTLTTAILHSLSTQNVIYDCDGEGAPKMRSAFGGTDPPSSQPVARIRRANQRLYDAFLIAWQSGRFPFYEDSKETEDLWPSTA